MGAENFARTNVIEFQLRRGAALPYIFLSRELSKVRSLSFLARPHVTALILTLDRLCTQKGLSVYVLAALNSPCHPAAVSEYHISEGGRLPSPSRCRDCHQLA